MTLPIYIPSRGRASAIVSRVSTVKYLSGYPEVYVVVPEAEVARYEASLKNNGIKVAVIGCAAEGIAKTRHWIGETAKAKKQKKFCMMDDDLTFNVRIDHTGCKLRPSKPEDIKEMVAWIEGALDNYAHASVAPRAQSTTMPDGAKADTWQENKRTLRLLAYQTKEFLAMKHGRVVVMEDFDVNLQLLESGHPNILHYWWTQDQRETGSPGGCSIYRTHEAHEASAIKLKELHPEFVTLREKENKAKINKAAQAFAKRTEVTIQWVKAFESSQR